MRLTIALVVSAALAAGTVDANAQGRGRGKHETSNYSDQKPSVSVDISIGKTDRRVIQEWFAQPANMRGLPPGLAKKEQLPPGLQKHLARNGQLPPGLQKKIQPLPPTLEARLTPLPDGHRRIFINGSIILLNERKNLIVDVMAIF